MSDTIPLPSPVALPDVSDFDAGQVLPLGCGPGGLQKGNAHLAFSGMSLTGLDQTQLDDYTLTQASATLPGANLTGRFVATQNCCAPTPEQQYAGAFTAQIQNASGTVNYQIDFNPHSITIDVTGVTLNFGTVVLTVNPDGMSPTNPLYNYINAMANAPAVQNILEQQVVAYLNTPAAISAMNTAIELYFEQHPALLQGLRC